MSNPRRPSNKTALQMPAFKGDGKRVPHSKKYANVSSKIDTGASLSKVQARAEYLATNYRYKKGEIFKRMKASTLAQLIIDDAESIVEYDADDLDEAATFAPHSSQARAAEAMSPAHDSQSMVSNASRRSTLIGLVNGVGAMDVNEPETARLTARSIDKPPFIILDLREPEEYERCHIRGAKNFHHVRLTRAQNYWTPEVYEYINKPDKIIIIYDEDESISHKAATTIVQRGVDNVFMLSGGLKVFADKIPPGLVVGVLPKSCRPAGRDSESDNSHLAPLTIENISRIRGKLEELIEGSVSNGSVTGRSSISSRTSTTSRTSTSRTPAPRKTSWR